MGSPTILAPEDGVSTATPAPWQELGLSDLPSALQTIPLCLVEFWAPDCLFNRLFAPRRATLAKRYEGRIALIRCKVSGAEPECAGWGIAGLPAFVLFRHGDRPRRWLGETHPSLVARAIDAALSRGSVVDGRLP